MKHLLRFTALSALLVVSSLTIADSSSNSCGTSGCNTGVSGCSDGKCGSCSKCSSSSNCCSDGKCGTCSKCCDKSCFTSTDSCGTNCSNGCCGTSSSNCCSSCCDTDNVSCKSHFTPRSQGMDLARLLVGRHHRIHLYDKDEMYGSFDVALAWQQTFRQDRLAKYISPNCNTTFTVGADGEALTNVRADDFGLNCTGQVRMCPRIQSFIADIDFFVGFNSWLEGLYADLQLPVVYTRWDSNCCFTNTQACGDDFEDFYMSQDQDKSGSVQSFQNGVNGTENWGDVDQLLCYAKLCCGKQTETRLADLRFRLGYDIWLKEDYHFGLKLVTAAPTGTKPDARFLWEPIAGNGGHWELGGGLTASALLWEKDEDSRLSWHLDSEITYMFKSREHRRTFDLRPNGCFSRYLLLKKFKQNNDNENPELVGLVRGPNVLTQCVRTQINVHAEVATLFSFAWNNWMFDLGYDGWFRSSEKLCSFCPSIADKTFGIKGIQPMAEDEETADLSTASTSTIAKAGDRDEEITYLTSSSINACSALHPSAISHSVFGNISYAWDDTDWAPSIGVGGKAEFSGRGNRAANQWQVWAKGGVAF